MGIDHSSGHFIVEGSPAPLLRDGSDTTYKQTPIGDSVDGLSRLFFGSRMDDTPESTPMQPDA